MSFNNAFGSDETVFTLFSMLDSRDLLHMASVNKIMNLKLYDPTNVNFWGERMTLLGLSSQRKKRKRKQQQQQQKKNKKGGTSVINNTDNAEFYVDPDQDEEEDKEEQKDKASSEEVVMVDEANQYTRVKGCNFKNKKLRAKLKQDAKRIHREDLRARDNKCPVCSYVVANEKHSRAWTQLVPHPILPIFLCHECLDSPSYRVLTLDQVFSAFSDDMEAAIEPRLQWLRSSKKSSKAKYHAVILVADLIKVLTPEEKEVWEAFQVREQKIKEGIAHLQRLRMLAYEEEDTEDEEDGVAALD